MDKWMLRWAPLVVPFFAFGGLDVLIGYVLLSDLRSSISVAAKAFLVIAYLLIIALYTLLGLFYKSRDRHIYVITSLVIGVLAPFIALLCPSYGFASNLSLAGIVIGMVYTVIGSMLFLSRIKK